MTRTDDVQAGRRNYQYCLVSSSMGLRALHEIIDGVVTEPPGESYLEAGILPLRARRRTVALWILSNSTTS
jgi:hypothetical protein